jgi:hypothetical protein
MVGAFEGARVAHDFRYTGSERIDPVAEDAPQDDHSLALEIGHDRIGDLHARHPAA